MKKIITITAILLFAMGSISYGETVQISQGILKDSTVTVMPVTTAVEMSNLDINRIVCPYRIKDVVFSKEKGLSVKIEGRDAFVKFLLKKDPVSDKYIPSETPSELYVVCGEKVFNIIAIPKNIPARTVLLTTGKEEKVNKNISLYKDMPYERMIVDIVKKVYTDSIPASFEVRKSIESIQPVYEGVKITKIRDILIEGEGIKVKEFEIRNTGQTELTLKEEDFLRPEITSNTIAISLDNLILSPSETGRLIILEENRGEN